MAEMPLAIAVFGRFSAYQLHRYAGINCRKMRSELLTLKPIENRSIDA